MVHKQEQKSPRVVCHLIASNFAGGPEKQIVEHCTRLERLGWRAVVGSFRENRLHVEILDNARERGLQTFCIDTRSPFSPFAVRQLRTTLKRLGAEVLVTHGYKSDCVGALACGRSGVAQLPFVRGYTHEDRRVRMYERTNRRLLGIFPRILCVSEGTRVLLAGYGLDPSRIAVVHNAVNCEPPKRLQPVDLRAEFSLQPDAKVVVSAGRLSPEKGHKDLLEAMRIVVRRDARVALVLIGAGREESALREQARSAGLDPQVRFAGFRTDVLDCLAVSEIVVNPSLTEGLPNVVLEAFSVRKPVVATDVGGVRELVFPGETGWLVPSSDPTALAEAMLAALADPARSAAMGERAYQLVSTRFTFAAQAARLAGLYDEAAARRTWNGSRRSSAAHELEQTEARA